MPIKVRASQALTKLTQHNTSNPNQAFKALPNQTEHEQPKPNEEIPKQAMTKNLELEHLWSW